MSEVVKGVVYKIGTKRGTTKTGRPYTLYSIKLDGDERYFGAGFQDPGAAEGETISFEVKPDGKFWNLDPSTIKRHKSDPVVVSKSVASNMSKDDYWKRKEDRDLLNDKLRNEGARRNTAIAFVELLFKTESLKLPTKIPDREAYILEMVNKYSEEFSSEPVTEEVEAEEDSPVQTADGENWN